MQKTIYKRKNKNYFFSIICATLGSENYIDKMINSLSEQNHKKFELIICDQNKNNKNLEILKRYKDINYKYVKCEKGLSLARNEGISKSSGDILIFIDDDIILEKNHLYKLNYEFNKKKIDILCYNVINQNNKKLLNYPDKKFYISKIDEIFNFISSVSFAIKKTNNLKFDTNIGLGSKSIFLSGEETDLIINEFKKKNKKIYFNNEIRIIHIERKLKYLNQLKKQFFYGCGWIYVVQKQDINKIFLFKNYLKIIFNFIFYFFTLRFVKSTYSLSTLLGRFYGLKKN